MTSAKRRRPTQEELAAIKARAEAATPGPWKGDPEPYAIYIYGADGSPVADTAVPKKPDYEDGARGGEGALLRLRGVGASKHRPPGSLAANYKFMIHAREDIPALLTEIEALQAKLQALHEVADDALDDQPDRGTLYSRVDSIQAVLSCPHNDIYHFHGDGCPSCISHFVAAAEIR